MKILLIILISCIPILCQTENSSNDEKNTWAFSIGYFPSFDNESFASSGIAFTLCMENVSNKTFNLGWYFIFRKTFHTQIEDKPDGSYSLGWSLSYHITNEPNTILVKIGLGLGYPKTFISLTNIFGIEYQYKISSSLALSLSILEEIAQFKKFHPPLVSIGIVF